MGLVSEYRNESAYEREMGKSYGDHQDELDDLSDDDLLTEVIETGEELNIDGFPAYDVAVKMEKNGWKPTPRQREAMINILAHYRTFGE
jgi:hypothetical protein